MNSFLIVFIVAVGVCHAQTYEATQAGYGYNGPAGFTGPTGFNGPTQEGEQYTHDTNVDTTNYNERVRKSWEYGQQAYGPNTYYGNENQYYTYGYPAYGTEDTTGFRGYRSAYHHEAPVHAGPAKSYSYPSPAPKVKCPSNLLLSCGPTVAHVPCVSPPSHHGKY